MSARVTSTHCLELQIDFKHGRMPYMPENIGVFVPLNIFSVSSYESKAFSHIEQRNELFRIPLSARYRDKQTSRSLFGMSPQDLFKQFEKVTSIDDSATILTAMKRHQTDLALERGAIETQLSKTQKLTKTGKTLITEATANVNVVVRTNVANTVATANVVDTVVNTITESISSFQIPVREDDLSISDPLFQDQIYDLKDHLYIEGLEIPGGGILVDGISSAEEERSVGFMVDRIPLMGNTDPGLDGRTPGNFPGTPEVSVPICDAAKAIFTDVLRA